MLPANFQKEYHLEDYIANGLASLDGQSWRVSLNDQGFDPETALYWADFLEFFEKTEPEKLEKMRNASPNNWETNLRMTLQRSLENEGTIQTIRKGFSSAGYQTINCSAPYPDDPRIKNAKEKYQANILRVMHQVHYQTQGNKSLDLVFFINGIPIATAEIKTELTQTVHDAIKEYQDNRRPIEPKSKRRNYLLMYKRGAVVHFAISEDEIYMCTNLSPEQPKFLPFNKGTLDGHAGNPRSEDSEYPTAYFWNEICQPDNWLHIFQNFVFEKSYNKENLTGRPKVQKAYTQIFPRYHQWDAVTKIIADTKAKGVGQKYLIEHSAGSGKTETITWTAHELADLRDKKGNAVFSSVIIVTDRLNLDSNIKKTIGQLKGIPGYVAQIGSDAEGHRVSDKSKSAQLAKALSEKRKIIVVTLQTFMYAWGDIAADENLRNMSFAVIIDEAHSSQEGRSSAALKAAFSAASDKRKIADTDKLRKDLENWDDMTDEESLNAYFQQMQSLNLMPSNVSFFAFTATPKAETRTMFGTDTGEIDKNNQPIKRSFHLYPMRQAIEEGYIVDPLSGYLPYKTAFKISESVDAKKSVDERKAKRVIAKWKSLHPTNVQEKTQFIIEHFVQNVAGLLNNQAKAMIITPSRAAVIRYKYAFDAFLKANPQYNQVDLDQKLQFKVTGDPLVAFSDKVRGSDCIVFDDKTYLKDSPFANIDPDYEYTESNINKLGNESIESAFDSPKYRFLIVANKFQTGFDQPKLCALYIDKPMSNDIEIVQTYSRVNRIYPGKDQVFILDFVNDQDTVLNAFAKYDTGAKMSEGQDPDIIYAIKKRLDAADIYTQDEFEKFRDAQYKAIISLQESPEQEKFRKDLYKAVSAPADRWESQYKAQTATYITWADYFARAEAEKDTEGMKIASEKMRNSQEIRDQLVSFRKDLQKFSSAYMFISQIIDLGEPDFEVFNTFSKLLYHKLSNTTLEDIDVKSLVLAGYRINKLQRKEDVIAKELKPMSAGNGGGAASKRASLKKIIEKLNETWGDDSDLTEAARVINFIADYVEKDTITYTRIVNSTNSKEAIFADGRLINIIKEALFSILTNSIGSFAQKIINDPQAIKSVADQIYDQISKGKRYSISDIKKFIEEEGLNGDQEKENLKQGGSNDSLK